MLFGSELVCVDVLLVVGWVGGVSETDPDPNSQRRFRACAGIGACLAAAVGRCAVLFVAVDDGVMCCVCLVVVGSGAGFVQSDASQLKVLFAVLNLLNT